MKNKTSLAIVFLLALLFCATSKKAIGAINIDIFPVNEQPNQAMFIFSGQITTSLDGNNSGRSDRIILPQVIATESPFASWVQIQYFETSLWNSLSSTETSTGIISDSFSVTFDSKLDTNDWIMSGVESVGIETDGVVVTTTNRFSHTDILAGDTLSWQGDIVASFSSTYTSLFDGSYGQYFLASPSGNAFNEDFTITTHASPIPEPSTYTAIIGCFSLILVAWRKRKL